MTGSVFDVSAEAERLSEELYYGALAPLAIENLGKGQLNETNAGYISRTPARFQFAACLSECGDLLDEIRFETALGAAFVWDHLEHAAVEPPNAEEDEVAQRLRDMPWPAEALALLVGYEADGPAPLRSMRDRHQKVTKSRVVGAWFGAQLLDSALFRQIAVLDRIGTLLWLAAGVAL